MRAAYERAIERSRAVKTSNQWFSVQTDHDADRPRIQRIERLPDQDPEFWGFVVGSRVADLAADVLGPDVNYRDSMINVKCPGTGGAVKWHQDLPFSPHTNAGTIQIFVALYDVTPDQGPLVVLPGSHRGEIYEHYDETGSWRGGIGPSDLRRIDFAAATELVCTAGDAIVLHPITVHGSGPNRSDRSRPLLMNGFDAADSIAYTPMTWGTSHTGETVRGQPTRYAHHEGLRIRLPPDWSVGYSSIFEHQGREQIGA